MDEKKSTITSLIIIALTLLLSWTIVNENVIKGRDSEPTYYIEPSISETISETN